MSHSIMFIAISLVMLCGMAPASLASSLSHAPVEAVRTRNHIIIDGILSEPEWQRPGVQDFTQSDPVQGSAPSQRTEVWVAFDDEALYVAARLYDGAPDSIIARLGRRDTWLDSDWFYVGIDSYHDRRTGFFFQVYASGTMVDGTLFNDSWNDNSWDGVWTSATAIDGQGWSIEIRISYSQLRFPEMREHTWAINFGRNIERRKEQDFLVMVPRGESGWVSRFADLTGIRNIDPPRRIEILPYALGSTRITNDFKPGDPFNKRLSSTATAGADLRIGLGNNFTLTGTVNPDFGQVEVDPAVVNLTQYETFFEEKRPFFIEGANALDFGRGGLNNSWSFNWNNPNFFYSRRIGRPPQGTIGHEGFSHLPGSTTILGAAKVTGKVDDDWSLGTLQAVTAREYGESDSAGSRFENVVEPLSYYGVTRVLREFNQGHQALGAMATTVIRDLNQPGLADEFTRRSFVGGFDGWTNLDSERVWVVSGWISGSRIEGSAARIAAVQTGAIHYYQRPGASHLHLDSASTSLSGFAARMMLNKQKGNWQFNSALGVISPGYDPNDGGYLSRADLLNGHAVVGYSWFEPDGLFRRKSVNMATFRSYDFGGQKIGDGYFLFAQGTLMNYWTMQAQLIFEPAVMDTRNTRGGPPMKSTNGYFGAFEVVGDGQKPLSLELDVEMGRTESGGYMVELEPGIDWKPTPGLHLSLAPSFRRDVTIAQWIGRFDDPTAVRTNGERYVFGKIDQTELAAAVRLDWTFTPALSFQLFLQPLISVGKYSDFKELAAPGTYSFLRYGENGSAIGRSASEGDYRVDPDGPGPAPSFVVGNPDFNVKALRGNAVLRWEYLPGSTLYLVWTQSYLNEANPGDFAFGRDVAGLFKGKFDNVLMLKISYWWNPS